MKRSPDGTRTAAKLGGEAGFSRRSFLALGLAGGAIGAGGLIAHSRIQQASYSPSPEPIFTDRVAAVLTSLMALWLPSSGDPFPRPADVSAMSALAGMWRQLPEHLRAQIDTALEAFEVAALVYGWHGQVFTRLPSEQQHAYVRRWAEGATAQRGLVIALRQLVNVSYWRQPQTWPATGYLGPLHERFDFPALGDAPEPTRA